MKQSVSFFKVIFLLLYFTLSSRMAAAGIVLPENEYDFGQRWQGDTVSHAFRIRNAGEKTITIKMQEMTGPFTSARFKNSLPPGQAMDVIVSVNTAKYTGIVNTGVVLDTDDPDRPSLTFRIRGQVNPILTLRPLRALFFSAYKGETPEKSIDIVNNYTEPLVITKVESKSDRFSFRIETIKKGSEYRFSAKLNPKASVGRTREDVTFFTDSKRFPQFPVKVNILVKDDVYAFPDEIDFGPIDLNSIRKNPQLLGLLNQTVLVKRREGKGIDFQITLEQDLAFLSIKKDPESGSETYNINISLIPEKMTPGEIDSLITVRTNDKDVPAIKIPVRGKIR